MKRNLNLLVAAIILIAGLSLNTVYAQQSRTLIQMNDQGDAGRGGGILRSIKTNNATYEVYIQPNSNIDLIFNKGIGNVEIEITDITGKVYYKKGIDSSVETLYIIDISNLPANMYTITISSKTEGKQVGAFKITN